MKRSVRMIACIASWTLCLALLVLWGRSTFAYDAVGVSEARFKDGIVTDRLIAVESNRASAGILVDIWHTPSTQPPRKRFIYGASHDVPQDVDDMRSFAGFRYRWTTSKAHATHTVFRLMVPYWTLALLAAWIGVRALVRVRRADALVTHGRCEGCGCELRGMSRHCPECGRAVRADAAGEVAG